MVRDPSDRFARPGHYYLIQEAAGSGGTQNLPTPEATGTIAMAATTGKVALTKSQTLLTVDNPVGGANVVDFIGYGTTADAYEGSGPAPAPSNTRLICALMGEPPIRMTTPPTSLPVRPTRAIEETS